MKSLAFVLAVMASGTAMAADGGAGATCGPRLSPLRARIYQKAVDGPGVLRDLGPQIQWVESFVTDDKIYCVYIAPDEALVREHARRGGFPANKVSQVRSRIDPTSAEQVGASFPQQPRGEST